MDSITQGLLMGLGLGFLLGLIPLFAGIIMKRPADAFLLWAVCIGLGGFLGIAGAVLGCIVTVGWLAYSESRKQKAE